MRSLPVPAFAAERKALGAISDDALAMAIQDEGGSRLAPVWPGFDVAAACEAKIALASGRRSVAEEGRVDKCSWEGVN
jgi:hypothetical protein